MVSNLASKRIGIGEYDTADGFHTRRYARGLFLHRAARLVPELLTSLTEAIEAVPWERFDLFAGDEKKKDDSFARALDQTEELRKAVKRWQKFWHITDDWVFDELHGALHLVSGNPTIADRVFTAWEFFDREPKRPFSPIYPPRGGLPGTTGFRHALSKPLPPLFVFRTRWYPQYEFRADIERFLRNRLERELTAYLDAIETEMQLAGLLKTRTKRPRLKGNANRDAVQHFDWLVLFQIQGETQAKIARRYGNLSVFTVAHALKSTAALIGMSSLRHAPARK